MIRLMSDAPGFFICGMYTPLKRYVLPPHQEILLFLCVCLCLRSLSSHLVKSSWFFLCSSTFVFHLLGVSSYKRGVQQSLTGSPRSGSNRLTSLSSASLCLGVGISLSRS